MIDDALRHVVNTQLEKKLFMDVLLHALTRNLMPKVKESMNKLFRTPNGTIHLPTAHLWPYLWNEYG